MESACPTCQTCGAALVEHWMLFEHEPVCRVIHDRATAQEAAFQQTARAIKSAVLTEKYFPRSRYGY